MVAFVADTIDEAWVIEGDLSMSMAEDRGGGGADIASVVIMDIEVQLEKAGIAR